MGNSVDGILTIQYGEIATMKAIEASAISWAAQELQEITKSIKLMAETGGRSIEVSGTTKPETKKILQERGYVLAYRDRLDYDINGDLHVARVLQVSW